MEKCRVALVDDDDVEIDFLKNSLEATQKVSVVVICCSYEEVVSFLDLSESPDIILCDLKMPKTTGL